MDVVMFDIPQGLHLAHIYNAQFANGDVPHCYPISEEEFHRGMVERTGDDQPVTTLGLAQDALKLIVAVRDGNTVGFAHVAIETRTWETPVTQTGLIRIFTYDRRDRAAGQTLLDAAEAYFKECEIRNICASPWFAPVRFIHTGREGISTCSPHVLSLFLMNGYTVEREQHIMDLQRIQTGEPNCPTSNFEVTVEHRSGWGKLPSFMVYLHQDGREVGVCEGRSHGHYLRAKDAQDALLIEDLDVIESEQGKGLGRFLLQRALWEGWGLGFQRADLRVKTDNYRALMLYASEGFQIVATGYQLRK